MSAVSGTGWSIAEEPRSFRVPVRGAELHVLEWGRPELPPVLLVHGMRAHAHWFVTVAPALSDAFHVLSVDLRGHGQSSQTPPYGPLAYAEDVRALARALDLRDLVLLGHSMGGGVVLRAAPELGDRLRALVVVDSHLGGVPPWFLERAAAASAAREQGIEPRPPRFAPRALVYSDAEHAISRFRLMPGGTCIAPELLRYLAERAIRPLEAGRVTWRFAPDLQRELPRPIDKDRIAALACPVLLIYGEHSPITAHVDAQSALAMFGGARSRAFELIEGAHHHVFLDQPAAFNAVLRRHLDALDPLPHAPY